MTCLAFNATMDINEIRKENLDKLLEKFSTIREFADVTGSAAAHISQMKNGVRPMGTAVARRIESAMKLPRGWMDQSHLEDEESKPEVSEEALKLAQVLTLQPADKLEKLRGALAIADISADMPENVVQLPPKDALIVTDAREKRLVEAFRSVNPMGQMMIDVAVRGALDNCALPQHNKSTNNQ